jgi:hypothetical protein
MSRSAIATWMVGRGNEGVAVTEDVEGEPERPSVLRSHERGEIADGSRAIAGHGGAHRDAHQVKRCVEGDRVLDHEFEDRSAWDLGR